MKLRNDSKKDNVPFNDKFVEKEPIFTAEEAKANVRSYHEQQSDRNLTQEQLNIVFKDSDLFFLEGVSYQVGNQIELIELSIMD